MHVLKAVTVNIKAKNKCLNVKLDYFGIKWEISIFQTLSEKRLFVIYYIFKNVTFIVRIKLVCLFIKRFSNPYVYYNYL